MRTVRECVFPVLVLVLFQAGPVHSGGRERTAAAERRERIPVGSWGGRHVGLEVTEKGGRLEFDCAHGTIDDALTVDAGGRFEAKGTLAREHGGPVREDEDPDARPARYEGRVEGKSMTLTVTLVETKETVGTFDLTFGKAPILRKCL